MKNYKKIYSDFQKYFFGTDEFSFLPYCDGFCYPVDLSFTLEDISFYYKPFDKNGIPYKVYSSVGEQYNPTRVAAYGLSHYNLFISSGEESAKYVVLKVADWFLGKQDARYEYKFNWQDLKSPWISCMAQGEAASLLVRAFVLTNDTAYLDHARKSLAPFFVDVSRGGVRSYLADNSVFLEEYPSAKPSHVLNGFLYSLIGLAEYNRFSEDEDTSRLFEQLLDTLIANIRLWSSDCWSLYEVNEVYLKSANFCTPSYHNLQISQLKWVLEHRPSNELREVVELWQRGLDSFPVRMNAMLGKVLFRLKNRAQR